MGPIIWAEEGVLLIFAIINWFLAKKLEKSSWLWAILTIIPFIGFVANTALLYMAIFNLLDEIEALHRLRRSSAASG